MPKTKEYKLISIYSTDYFGAENEMEESPYFWMSSEFIPNEGWAKFMLYLGYTEEQILENFQKFAEKEYPKMFKCKHVDLDMGELVEIKELQFYDKPGIRKKIAECLFLAAMTVLFNSSGDDSYFDYDPGFARYCLVFIEQLGKFPKYMKPIEKILEQRHEE